MFCTTYAGFTPAESLDARSNLPPRASCDRIYRHAEPRSQKQRRLHQRDLPQGSILFWSRPRTMRGDRSRAQQHSKAAAPRQRMRKRARPRHIVRRVLNTEQRGVPPRSTVAASRRLQLPLDPRHLCGAAIFSFTSTQASRPAISVYEPSRSLISFSRSPAPPAHAKTPPIQRSARVPARMLFSYRSSRSPLLCSFLSWAGRRYVREHSHNEAGGCRQREQPVFG